MSKMYGASNPLAAVILNWNAAAETIRAARSLAAWKFLRPIIVIVDNASSAEDRAVLQREANFADLLFQPQNLGYAGGNNAGIRHALERGCENILLLNNDAVIEEHDAQQLIEALSDHPHWGIAGPLLEEQTVHRTYWTAGGRDLAIWPHTRRTIRHLPRPSPPFPVSYVPGTVAVVRTQVFRQVGLFDERFFFSGEMADLCRRARDANFQCIIVPSAHASHCKRTGSTALDALHAYYTLRNRFLYVSKHGGRARCWYSAYWSLLGWIMKKLAAVQGQHALQRAMEWALQDAGKEQWGPRNELFI